MNPPELAIIMPVYNEQASVRKVVTEWFHEVENWTENFVFLCIDDGSKDKSLEILKRLQQQLGDRIHIVSRENRVLPFILLLLSLGLLHLWQSDKILNWTVVLTLCLLLIFSSLSIRFSPRFAKDDYRTAAQIAKSSLENGKTIWWAADSATANYYGLEFDEKLINILGFSKSDLQNAPASSLVLLSKADIYDSNRFISDFLAKEDLKTSSFLKAFSVYRPDNTILNGSL